MKTALGWKIDLLLAEKRMNHKELAERLGIGRQNISQLKRGKRPSAATIGKLAKAFDVSPAVFFDLE